MPFINVEQGQGCVLKVSENNLHPLSESVFSIAIGCDIR